MSVHNSITLASLTGRLDHALRRQSLLLRAEGEHPDQVLSGADIKRDNRPYQTHDQTHFEVLHLTYLRSTS